MARMFLLSPTRTVLVVVHWYYLVSTLVLLSEYTGTAPLVEFLVTLLSNVVTVVAN